jgi:hypothetical protein
VVSKVFATVAMIVGGIAALATAGSFFRGFWWGLDLVANFRWQWMWVALIASVVYALSGKSVFTVVFFAVAAINMWMILPAWIGSQPEATGEDTVRVAHIDISGNVDDLTTVGSWLLTSGADLLLVSGATAGDVTATGIEASPYMPLNVPGEDAGIAVYGKDAWTISTTLSGDGQPVHSITVGSGTGVIDVVTAWGEMGTSQTNADSLFERLVTVTDVVDGSANPVTVIGNLGATKWAETSDYLLTNSTLRDATAGSGYLPTWPTSTLPVVGRWIGIPIDVVYMEPDLTPLKVTVGPDIGAEHLPITIDISPVAGS